MAAKSHDHVVVVGNAGCVAVGSEHYQHQRADDGATDRRVSLMRGAG